MPIGSFISTQVRCRRGRIFAFGIAPTNIILSANLGTGGCRPMTVRVPGSKPPLKSDAANSLSPSEIPQSGGQKGVKFFLVSKS
jgi:hypothetical protein